MGKILKKIFNGLNVAYLVSLSLFLIGYFRAKTVLDSLIAEAIARGNDVYYYLSYGRKGLLYLVFSFIILSTIFFMKQLDVAKKKK